MFEPIESRQERMGKLSLAAVLLLVGLLAVQATSLLAAPKGPPKIPLDRARCPVTNGTPEEKFVTEYKGAKLFFANADALADFQASKKKFVDRANLQLVATKQYRQTACPLTGRPLSKNFAVTIEGVPIYVCCKNCVLMSAKAKLSDQLKFFFCDEVFDRQYRKSEPEEAK